jgi:hypothetical protein
MQKGDIAALLWQGESETLDFKRDQYPFDGATDDQRSELVKDILAFANAWRTTPARILIGVEEVKHGRSIPVGTEHLLNRTLQTFIGSKVNRAIAFSYEAVEVDGTSIGVIEIPVQERPIFLIRKYGKLEANTVYIRRGDTTVTADPDEIAQMGEKREESRKKPVLNFCFGNLERRKKFEGVIKLQKLCLDVPADEEIPGYGTSNALGFTLSNENQNFYADCALYLRDVAHLEPIGVVVENGSRTTAQQIVVRIRFAELGVDVLTPNERRPEPSKDYYSSLTRALKFTHGLSVVHGDGWSEVEIELGDVQPGTSAWSSAPFYIGCRTSGQLEPQISISGHNLPEPISLKRQFEFDVQLQQLSVDKLVEYGDSLDA